MAANQPTPDFDDELLSAYVDNELTPAERAAVEERLRTDERARLALAELQRAADAVKSLPARRLNRDLTANVWAAIDSQTSDAAKAEDPAVLTLPPRDATRDSGMGRGLIWTAAAIAAALMLMVLLPSAELENRGSVAKSTGKSDAQAPKDPEADSRNLARAESTDDNELAAAATRQGAVATGAAAEHGSEERATVRSEATRSRSSENEIVANPSAAPQVSRSAAASTSLGVGPSRISDDAQSQSLTDAPLVSESVRTIEVVASGGAAAFERMLSQHQITIASGPDELAPLAATASPPEAKAADGGEAENAEERFDDRDAAQASAPIGILVEASPEAIAEVIAMLQPRAESLYALGSEAEMDAVGGGVDGAAAREADATSAASNIARRVPLDSYNFRNKSLEESAAATPSTMAVSGGGLGGAGSALGGRAFAAEIPRERVLFIVRPE